MMNTCLKCFRVFEEPEIPKTPMEELGQIFLGSVTDNDAENVCPECREELGMLNMLGFGK